MASMESYIYHPPISVSCYIIKKCNFLQSPDRTPKSEAKAARSDQSKKKGRYFYGNTLFNSSGSNWNEGKTTLFMDLISGKR